MKSRSATRPTTLLRKPKVPLHIAIIMDGNGRWAEAKGMPRLQGHRAGVNNIRPTVECLSTLCVKYVTLYAFSTENWNRPPHEVDGIMEILQEMIDEETDLLHQKGVRLIHLGKQEHLSPQLQKAISRAQEITKDNQGITLNVAFDYGGRAEILEAVKRIISDGIPPEEVDSPLFSRYLYTADIPDPDLIIRTGGELRLSNFLLWQSAYSEYYATYTLWPDFGKREIKEAISAYNQRQRRFGTVTPEA